MLVIYGNIGTTLNTTSKWHPRVNIIHKFGTYLCIFINNSKFSENVVSPTMGLKKMNRRIKDLEAIQFMIILISPEKT